MKKKSRRLAALFIALVMLMALALPVFAESDKGEEENEGNEPWRKWLGILGAAASYLFVFGVILIGFLFFVARIKSGRRGY